MARFTTANIVKGSFKLQYVMPGEETADAVTVEFFSPKTWKPAEVTVSLPRSLEDNPATVNLFGCTNQTQAMREGTRDPKTDLLTLNDELVISLVLARCQITPTGHQRWRIRFDPARFDPARFDPDITVAIRLDAANAQELDYYLLPRLDLPEQEIRVSNKNSADFECFRFDDLNFFYGMSERERLQRRV